MWIEQVENIRDSPNPERVKSTIFEGVLGSKLPEEDKTNARLAHEAQLVVFAGQGTTGTAQRTSEQRHSGTLTFES